MALLLPFAISFIVFFFSKQIYFNQKYILKQLIKGLSGGIIISLICFKILPDIFIQTNIFITAIFTLLGVFLSVYFDGNRKKAYSLVLFTAFSLGVISCFILTPFSLKNFYYIILPLLCVFNFGIRLKDLETIKHKKFNIFFIAFFFGLGFLFTDKAINNFFLFKYIGAIFIGSSLYDASADVVFENCFDITSVFAFMGFIFQTVILCYF